MASNIRLDLTELMRVQSRGEEVNQQLLIETNKAIRELNYIVTNLSNATALGKATERLQTALDLQVQKTTTNFARVVTFLKQQIDAYGTQSEDTKQALQQLLSSLEHTSASEVVTPTTSIGAMANLDKTFNS